MGVVSVLQVLWRGHVSVFATVGRWSRRIEELKVQLSVWHTSGLPTITIVRKALRKELESEDHRQHSGRPYYCLALIVCLLSAEMIGLSVLRSTDRHQVIAHAHGQAVLILNIIEDSHSTMEEFINLAH